MFLITFSDLSKLTDVLEDILSCIFGLGSWSNFSTVILNEIV